MLFRSEKNRLTINAPIAIQIACVILILLSSACQNQAASSGTEPVASPSGPAASATQTLTPLPSSTPTSTQTPTVTPSPTITPSPTAIIINRENITRLKPIAVYGDGELRNLSWSADKKTVALCFNHAVRVMAWQDGFTPITRISSIEPLGECALSPDGQSVVAGVWPAGKPANIFVWDARYGGEIARLTGGTGGIHAVEFAPDGSFIATGGLNEVIVWNTSDFSRRYTFDQGSGVLAVSPDNRYVASIKTDLFFVWDVSTGSQTIKPVTNDLDHWWIEDIEFEQDSNTLVLTGGRGLEYWDIQRNEQREIRKMHECSNFEFEILEPARLYAYHCYENGELIVRDIEAGKEVLRLAYGEEGIPRIASGPDANSIILIHNSDNRISLEQIKVDTGERSTLYKQTSLPGCYNQFDWNNRSFQTDLADLFKNQINGPADDPEGIEFPERPGYSVSKMAVSPGRKLVAVVFTKMDDQYLLGGELIVSGIPFNMEKPLITYSNLLEDPDAERNDYQTQSGPHSLAFTKDSSLVTADARYHLLTWDTKTGELVSDVNLINDVGDSYAWDIGIYGIRDMVYTEDDILIATDHGGWLYFVDTRSGKILGKTENTVDDGHYMLLSNGEEFLYQSTCNFSSPYEEPPRWWSSNRVIVLWGIDSNLHDDTASIPELLILPTPAPALIAGSIHLTTLKPDTVEGSEQLGVGVFPFSEGPALKGHMISANGVNYPYGLFAHAPLSISYTLDDEYSLLKTELVMANYAGCDGDGAIFRVLVDGEEVFISDLMTRDNSPISVEIPIQGSNLTLETLPGPADNPDCDWAVWGDPILIP